MIALYPVVHQLYINKMKQIKIYAIIEPDNSIVGLFLYEDQAKQYATEYQTIQTFNLSVPIETYIPKYATVSG
jgi:hypothetical protein